MADGDVLQIVVFSILFAVALGMIGEKGRPVVWCEAVAETMFKFTNIVMHYAPVLARRSPTRSAMAGCACS